MDVSLDIPVQTFLILRSHFFDDDGKPIIYELRDKLNTQDDPLDEYIYNLISKNLPYKIVKASPLVSPDLVVYNKERISDYSEAGLCEDTSIILALEVKKLSRTPAGSIARKSGLDYNTTPPCGKVRIYIQNGNALDIRGFYLFVCQEKVPGANNNYTITALTLCDGNAINMDFNLYLSAVETREKDIGLGTFSNGLNRQRPMYVFSNPLGLEEMDRNVTLIHQDNNIDEKCEILKKMYKLNRKINDEKMLFWCYRYIKDIPEEHELYEIDDFPTPRERKKETQPRGKLRISI